MRNREKRTSKLAQPVFDQRGKWPISFYDLVVLFLSFAMFCGIISWSWWFVPIYVLWSRPYYYIADVSRNLVDNLKAIELERKMTEEQIEILRKERE